MKFFGINSIKQLTSVIYCYILLVSQGEVIHMHIIINNTSMVPVYEQLINQIKQEIIDGGLKEDEALPSVRSFANDLKISALTVKKAYDKLEEEGFIVTIHGKGSYVAATNRQLAAEARKKSVENDFAIAIERAKALGLNDDEIREILEILLGE